MQTIFIVNSLPKGEFLEELRDDERVISAGVLDGVDGVKVVVKEGAAEDIISDYCAIRVPSDLITQAEVVKRFGVSPGAVNNAIRDGRLTPYPNPDAANPRRGGTLVSRAEADNIWSDKLHKVIVRETRRGDWLVAAAQTSLLGVGVRRTGTPNGYVTGMQYGRFPTEGEAIEFAKTIGEIVAWQPPVLNEQFVDLPQLFPTHTEYNTLENARADGWINITPDKTIEHYKGHKIMCVDVTPGRWFGENFAIVIRGRDGWLAESSQIWIQEPLGFSVRFRTGDVVNAIHQARQIIDGMTNE